jgi:hypothetical protein
MDAGNADERVFVARQGMLESRESKAKFLISLVVLILILFFRLGMGRWRQ